MVKKTLSILICSLWAISGIAQQVDIEKISKIGENKPIAINGGLSLGNVFYSGNQTSGRQDWTYYLNGTVNFNIYGQLNIPITVNLTNLGKDLSYPSLPNRLSIHPTYKWITGHIGDVSMTFSPYTLNGHQFTGAGVELTPPGKFKVSAMGGRLLKKVEYDYGNPYIMPNYSRIGGGAKVQYDDAKFSVGMIYFGAKDQEKEDIYYVMDSLGITPAENNVFSWNASLNFVKNMNFTVEYAISLFTRDKRAPKESSFFLDNILGRKTSTSAYHALNARLNYQIHKNTIGIGYERIDPEYHTLGAYYFNNDYENITLNFARPFLKDDKANIAVSFGVQRDDLDNTKEESSDRYVGSVNLNYNPTEDLQMSLNFSTFQSYRNVKSQFDYINEVSPYDNMDTLQFSQLSQNLDFSAMYTFKKTEKQNQRLNLLVSYQESADRQGKISLPGGVSRFVNSALGYGLQLIPQGINITSSLNASYSYGAATESYTIGPMVGATASFLKKSLTTGFSTAYNINMDGGDIRARVFNLRLNAAYRMKKKHSLNANMVWQNRNITDKSKKDAITTTVSYAYSF
ncbi:hypothetical protein [Dysgonomonas sp. 511]|uniref:hypothetical protein n=1 Tax=Dysgonomonas sp. 511 TaxID=2302930 RepID=UPI0013D15D15|nr:hypothetical protein [Dysgonomonas sp. 511]NDV79492.1 hypothetical protein [Dysgonomonas sp. 511]